MKIAILVIFSVVVLATTASEEPECSSGQRKQVECGNTCICANGLWACTKKGCAIPARFEEVSRNKRGTCKPGETYQKDCNTCTCTETGLEICTAKACL